MGMDRIPQSRIDEAKKLVGDFFADESSSGQGPALSDFSGLLKAGAVATALYASTPDTTEAKPLRVHIGPKMEQQHIKETFNEGEAYLLALNTYHEARGETPEGQLGTVQVVLARLLSGKFGDTVRLVIYSPNQFSWTNGIQKPLQPDEKAEIEAWGKKIEAFLKGKTAKQAVAELSAITGIPQNATFYKRTDWREDDPDEKRMSEKTKQMFLSMIKVAKVGRHTFYVEPPRLAKKN